MKLLLVKDEKKLTPELSHQLAKNGYLVDTASDGEAGIEMAVTGVYDVIILDNRLPRRDGISVLKELRGQGCDTPVMLLTVEDEPQGMVESLDAGADDCLARPFSTDELLARLRALTRRRNREYVGNTVTAAGMTLDPLRGQVTIGQQVVHLTVKESSLLEMLMRNCGQVITKERIFEKVWGCCSGSEIANVDLYIHYLRKKLNVPYIKTLRGIGYCLREDSGL